MFQVKPMTFCDFDFAVALANTMDWNMAKEDFQFALKLEPEGCLVAFNGSKRIGIATCISYGKVGWFGNLIVGSKYRRKGVGGLLVENAVEYLQSKGVETVGLYAYPNLKEFYKNHGFSVNEDFSVMHASALKPVTAHGLPAFDAKHMDEISAFDRCCFGGDRRRLLESIIQGEGNLGFLVSEGGKVEGYVAATVYEAAAWVGPLICREGNVDAAVMLLGATLAMLAGKSVYLVLPKKQTAFDKMLSAAGFKETFSVSRMFLGSSVAKNCIYMAESLERG